MVNKMFLMLVSVSFDTPIMSRNPKLKGVRTVCNLFLINAVKCQRAQSVWACSSVSRAFSTSRGRGTRLFDSKESISVSLTMLREILPTVGFRMELRVLGTSGEY